MGGDSDDDFTFCQVSPPSNRNGFDDPNAVPDISSIAIKDENPSGSTGETTLVKQKTVGALSFNVIDASSKKKSDNVPLQSGSGSGVSIKDTTGRDPTVKKPAGRAKVPFEKGYSQMDWLKLTRMHPDLAGLKGQSSRRLISMSEVKQHQTEGSMWTVLKGQVYNIAPYMKFHPGGVDMLMKAVGKDCTSLFNKYHAWVNAEFLLEKCLVGIFDENGDRK